MADAKQKDESKAAKPAGGQPKTPKDKLSILKEEISEGEKPVEISVPMREVRPPIAAAPKPKKQPIPAAPGKAEGTAAATQPAQATKAEPGAPAPAAQGPKLPEDEAILKDIVKEAEEEALKPGAIVHRRYLIGAKGGAAKAGAKPKVRKPGEEPEFAEMVQDVYGQVKAPAKPAARPVAKRPEKKEAKVEAPVEEKKITMEDILGGPKEGAGGEATGGAAPAPLFAELEQISGKPAPKAEEKPSAPAAKQPAGAAGAPVAAPNVCPTCATKGVKLNFCPYCGTGFCANCSPSVKPAPEAFYYVCPKCGEEVTVKRK